MTDRKPDGPYVIKEAESYCEVRRIVNELEIPVATFWRPVVLKDFAPRHAQDFADKLNREHAAPTDDVCPACGGDPIECAKVPSRHCDGTAGQPTDDARKLALAREALKEAEDTFRLVERPRSVDPVYGEEVKRLGDRIGYGALMSSASASWRAKLAVDGAEGGEFVSGPCHGTAVHVLELIRAALAAIEGAQNNP